MLAGKNLNSCPDSDSDETLTLDRIFCNTYFQNLFNKKGGEKKIPIAMCNLFSKSLSSIVQK